MKPILPVLLALSSAHVALAAPTAPTPPVSPQSLLPTPVIDQRAVAVLEQSAQAYGALKGLSMRFSTIDQKGEKTRQISGMVAFSRPNRVRLQAQFGTQKMLAVSDGDKLFNQFGPGSYQSQYVQEDNLLVNVLNGIPSALSNPLPIFVNGENPATIKVPYPWEKVSLLKDNGVLLATRLGPGSPLITFRLYFDATDHLLRRVEAQQTAQKTTILNLTSITEVQVNPEFGSDVFKFVPEKGATEMAAPTLYNPKLKVGAVPIAIRGRDLSGKPVTLANFQGKVALIHFWATFNQESVIEMPEMERNYAKYHEQGFEVLGISVDNDQKALKNFIKARKIPWAQIADSKVNTAALGLRVIPFSLLIGKDGKIAAINPRGARLSAEIEKAMAQ